MSTHARSYSRGRRRIITSVTAVVLAVVIAAGIVLYNRVSDPAGPLPDNLPTSTASYLGVFVKGVPQSYSGVTAFEKSTGANPDIITYYSGWYQPFPTGFAATAANNGKVPLVQLDPDGIKIASIVSGKYDGYLSSFAETVRAYGHPVIISFGHEMNGDWSSWGYRHTSPTTFVAAWQHIVKLFRVLGARNVTWLWTVNIINNTQRGRIPSPRPWWPGNSYVTWVGIDGYYLKPNWTFAPLFGPTIEAVRSLTSSPILIAETGATPASNQPAKINDLFAGIRNYGLLGFVYFNATNTVGVAFGINSPAAITAFSKGAKTYSRP